MEWPVATLQLFEDEMEVIEAEERIKRVSDAQMGGGLLKKQDFNAAKRRLEKAARGRQIYQGPREKVDPRSPAGRMYLAQLGMPVELVDRHGNPIDLGGAR